MNDTLLDLIETADTLHTMFVATMSGELILSREMGFAETALPDQVAGLERYYRVSSVVELIDARDEPSGAFISPSGGWIISYARLGEPNWVIVTLVDRRDLQGDVFAAALIGVVLMFILLALQAALIGFIYHKRVVRPLRALARGHGPESETASPLSDEERAALIAREDEVGVLAGSLERAQHDHDELVETLERRVAQRTVEYRRASEAKSVFLATMSHELRTPLNAIMGMLDVLALQALESDAARHVKVAHSSACALLKIIDDVLDFSKIEAGELSLENIPFDPYAVFEQHLEGIRGVAETKGLKLTAALSEDLPDCIIGDPTRVGQILMNLLGNAVKFTEQGEVSLQVDYDVKTQSLYAAILDTGIGLDPDAAPKLFTRFSQADDSTTRRFGGTGLGLAICRELVEAMDGEIGAERRADGGSRFWFKIKAPISGKAPVAKPRGAQTRRTDGYAMNVLVADDNLNNQEVAKALLDAAGHMVVLVDDGAQAIEALETSEFDLLLLDIQMPVLDGVETTKRIRAHKDLRVATTPIIGLTANAILSEHEKFKAAGMDDVLTKPIRLDALFVALRKFAQWSDEGDGGGGEDADDADFSDEDFGEGPLSRSA